MAGSIFDNFVDDEQKRNQWNAMQMQNKAMEDYARQKEEVDKAHPDKKTGLAGLLSGLFKDWGAVGNTIATTASAFASPFVSTAQGMAQQNNLNAAKEDKDKIAQKYGYKDWNTVAESGEGPDEMWQELQGSAKKSEEQVKKTADNYKNNAIIKKINDTKQSQYGADALRTEKQLFQALVPAAAASPIGGAVTGAIDGFADAVENTDGTLVDLQSDLSGGKIKSAKDTSLDWGDALKRAAIGATAGAATAGVGSKLGNATSGIGSKLLNNKFVTSGIGRGAIGGAVGGAVGSGLGAALEGGDIAGAALQGAGSGALAGGVSGGLASGARKVGGTVANKLGIADNLQAAREKLMYSPQEKTPIAEAKVVNKKIQEAEIDDSGMPDYTKPKDWAGNEVTLTRKNKISAAGDALERTGDAIRNQDIYNKLDKKTADRIVKNGSIGKLRKLGINPSDYEDAATISTAVNKFYNDIVDGTGASIRDPDFIDRANNLPNGISLSDSDAKTYSTAVKNLSSELETGSMPGEYKANALLSNSRRFKQDAATAYKNGHKDLGAAYNRLGKDLRAMADKATDNIAADNYTKQQLTAMLKNLGANDKTIGYLTDFKNLSEGINKTAVLEDARTMNEQMQSTNLSRNGMSGDNSERIATQMLRKSGVPQIAGTVLSPLGKLSGNIVTGIGKGLQAVGGTGSIEPIPTVQTTPDMQNIFTILGTKIGESEGDNARSTAIKNREYKNIEDQLAGTMAQAEELYNRPVQNTASNQAGDSRLTSQLQYIANAMDQAMSAGDLASYSKLASLYKDAYDIYKTQTKSSSSDTKLSKTQQQANAAALALEKLEGMNPDFGYAVSDIPVLNLVNAQGNAYSSAADGLALNLGYLLSGATVNPSEREAIKEAYVPKPWDNEATRKRKLELARDLIMRYQNGYVTNDQTEA